MLDISEIRVELANTNYQPRPPRVLAYVNITFSNSFVVRNFKVVETPTRGLIVSMPTRRIENPCVQCYRGCPVQGIYCPWCGVTQPADRAPLRHDFPSYHADIAHPVNPTARDWLHGRIMAAYREAITNEQMTPNTPITACSGSPVVV